LDSLSSVVSLKFHIQQTVQRSPIPLYFCVGVHINYTLFRLEKAKTYIHCSLHEGIQRTRRSSYTHN
jgi:hypothetical protein